jgi:hypothetical protein
MFRKTPIILKIFINVDLRCAHKGLGALAQSQKIDVQRLSPGEFLMFMNRARSAVKILGASHLLVHLKSGSNKAISEEALITIPRLFSGSDFDFKRAARLDLVREEQYAQ